MAKICCFVIFFMYLTLTSCANNFRKSIHLAPHLKHKDLFTTIVRTPTNVRKAFDKNIPTFLQGALNELRNNRIKRDASNEESGLKPNSSVFSFNDSHTQMVVHWAGQESNVIISLTKGIEIGSSGIPSITSHTSNVFISHNYGASFISIKDKLQLFDGRPAVISQFFNSPALNSHYIFTDEDNKYIFRTPDYGTTIYTQSVAFKPSRILFHQSDFKLALAMDTSASTDGTLYLTEDFGETWRELQRGVRAFYWEDSRYGNSPSCIYILRVTANDLGNIIRSCDFFRNDEIELLSFVHDFEIQEAYMFATRKRQLLGGNGLIHQIWVSYYRGQFYNAQFPHALNHSDYYVADASEDQIFLCVSHDESTTHLYISDVNGTKFSQSLDDILYFHPNGSNANSWLKYYLDEPFADLRKVEGMRGVYIATQLINKTLASDHQRTLISFDKGGEWQLLVAPERDVFNRPTNCSVQKDAYTVTEKTNCSLHLTQTFDRLYAGSRSSPILSRESAPGLILATGNTGQRIHVDEASGVFVSADAGFTWHEVLQGTHLFALADHGGIILAAKQYEPTNQIVYSTDEGETWKTYNFTTTPIHIHGLLTEPGEKTTVFFLFGAPTDRHSWIVTSIDMRSVFNYQCTDSDYKQWSLPDNTPFQGCLLGRKLMIERRVPHTNCYNGKDYVRETTVRNCTCTREDFECDFGYKPSTGYWSSQCIEDKDMDVNIHQVPNPCPEGTFYPYTRGYVKVSGDTCQGGEEHRYAPLMYACRVQDEEEFLLYASQQSIKRRVLDTNQTDTSLVLKENLRNVSAVAYQLKETACIYWADNALHKIQRLCEDGNHTVEALHFAKLGEVTSIAYDWQGLNVYWIDRQRRVLEVSKRNGLYRRELFNGSKLIQPHSLALDPNHGWMYWTDAPKLQRAWMDGTGSSLQTVLTDIEMTSISRITIDHLTEKIYWVTSSGIKSASLDGSNMQTVYMTTSDYSGYYNGLAISSLGIYKGIPYWGFNRSPALYQCESSDCTLITRRWIDQPIVDLQVLDETSQRGGNTACQQNGACTQLCLLKPPVDVVHGRNRTCRCGENATLSVILPGSDEDEQCCQSGGLNNTGHCAPLNNTCTPEQFACRNGQCISRLWTCDRDNDCSDGSDELDCPYETCSEGHFTCGNGRCIPQNWKCDFDNDCLDGTDEMHCAYPACAADKFSCDDGRCINKNWRCDFDTDCPDGSDENNCTTNVTVCEENEFVCVKGSPHCIQDIYKCDGSNQCYDGSDEANCSSTACPSWKKSCGDGGCVYSSWWCDGDKDCTNGADEANCSYTTTAPPNTPDWTTKVYCNPAVEFRCATTGFCLPARLHCDTIDDCGDNSDEMNCDVRNHTCMTGEFSCRNGRCVAWYFKCNGHNDCGDYSDEAYCGSTVSPQRCPSQQFECYNSTWKRCIYMAARCDGDRDCDRGEDELNCPGSTCDQSKYFRCRSSQGCILKKFVCDETYHCADGSDELGCNKSSDLLPSMNKCSENYFSCQYEKKCLPYIFVCDGKPQCQHSSDENQVACFDGIPDVNTVNAKMQASSATLTWSTVSQKNATYILSYLSYINQVYSYNNISNLTAAVANNYSLTNLHPATTYYITVYARLSINKLQKYQVLTVTTSDDVPDPPEEVSAKVSEDSSTLQVSWKDPRVFKGTITDYWVYIGKKSDVFSSRIHTKLPPQIIDGVQGEKFEAGQIYYIKVAAVTSAGEGKNSSTINITFSDAISAQVDNLMCKPVGNHTVNVSWTAPSTHQELIQGYLLEYYDQLDTKQIVTLNKTTIFLLVDQLCAGTRYEFQVTPFASTTSGTVKSTTRGIPISKSVLTNGALLKPTNITSDLVEPTSVKITWSMPAGADPSENFTVYYSYDPTVMYAHKVTKEAQSVQTTTNSTTITQLRACEVYFFAVQVSGTGSCSLGTVQSFITSPDDKAPPKDIKFEAISKTSGQLTWNSSCVPVLATGYIVYKTEVGTNERVPVKPYFSTNATYLNLTYQNLKPGATYMFTVINTNPGARMSEPVNYTMDPYGAPINLQGPLLSNPAGTLSWMAPQEPLPTKTNGYEIVMCRQALKGVTKCSQDTEYQHYAFSNLTAVNYTSLEGGYEYYFKVRLNKINGYYGSLSAATQFIIVKEEQPVTSAPFIQLSQTNIIAIAVSIAVVILCLVVIIGCFIVRHRRLQNSFHAYASSHYDSRSGTTTFTAADELGEDEDSPMIRGFSDDEPLVIA